MAVFQNDGYLPTATLRPGHHPLSIGTTKSASPFRQVPGSFLLKMPASGLPAKSSRRQYLFLRLFSGFQPRARESAVSACNPPEDLRIQPPARSSLETGLSVVATGELFYGVLEAHRSDQDHPPATDFALLRVSVEGQGAGLQGARGKGNSDRQGNLAACAQIDHRRVAGQARGADYAGLVITSPDRPDYRRQRAVSSLVKLHRAKGRGHGFGRFLLGYATRRCFLHSGGLVFNPGCPTGGQSSFIRCQTCQSRRQIVTTGAHNGQGRILSTASDEWRRHSRHRFGSSFCSRTFRPAAVKGACNVPVSLLRWSRQVIKFVAGLNLRIDRRRVHAFSRKARWRPPGLPRPLHPPEFP